MKDVIIFYSELLSFLECFFTYEVSHSKHSHNLHHLQLAYACQISTINEAADDEMNSDVDMHEI